MPKLCLSLRLTIGKWKGNADKRLQRENVKISTKRSSMSGLTVSFSAKKQKIGNRKKLNLRRLISRIVNLLPKRRL